MTRLCHTLLRSALLLGMAAGAKGYDQEVRTVSESGVRITVSSPISESPAEGCMPCWITIQNDSGAAHTWDIELESSNLYNGGGTHVASSSMRVENGATVRLPFLVPPVSLTSNTFYRRNMARVNGYGVEQSSVALPQRGYSGSKGTAYIGMGEELATPLWESLRHSLKDAALELSGSPVDIALLWGDWRALSGFDCLWLTEAEYASMDPARRRAIRDWIDRGGVFFLTAKSLEPALRASLGAPPGLAAEWSAGFGSVKVIPWDGKELKVEEAARLAQTVPELHRNYTTDDAFDWPMTRSIGAISFNAPFLIAFIFLFAVTVGPVNLFWLAGARRRHRLFWTTPLISLVASLLLIAVIILQDGFGGRGERLMVTRLFPDQKKAFVIQEQVARTGVLLSRSFTVSEDLLLSPLKMRAVGARTYEQAGRAYSGDWFTSRSLQAQRLEAIVPSRAEVQLVNAEAAAGGAPPEVVSSIPAPLSDFRYVDPHGAVWRGQAVRIGERVTLRRDDASGPLPHTGGSDYLFVQQSQFRKQPGSFYAVADDAPFLATLPSIRWNKQLAIYLGPVTTP